MSFIKYEKSCHLGILAFNNPKRLNALDFEVLDEFNSTLDIIKEDNDVYCLIIMGTGNKSFISGGDIKLQNSFDVLSAFKWSDYGQECIRKLERLPIPVIGAINGYALGGGTEVALACDILIASDKAIFSQPEVSLGITPGFGGTQRLPRKIGLNKAKELIFTGRRINAEEALQCGLVNKVVPHEKLLDEAINMAELIIKNAPIAIRLAKLSINEGIQCDIDRGLSIEKALFSECFSTEDKTTAMNAFLNKEENVLFKNK